MWGGISLTIFSHRSNSTGNLFGCNSVSSNQIVLNLCKHNGNTIRVSSATLVLTSNKKHIDILGNADSWTGAQSLEEVNRSCWCPEKNYCRIDVIKAYAGVGYKSRMGRILCLMYVISSYWFVDLKFESNPKSLLTEHGIQSTITAQTPLLAFRSTRLMTSDSRPRCSALRSLGECEANVSDTFVFISYMHACDRLYETASSCICHKRLA